MKLIKTYLISICLLSVTNSINSQQLVVSESIESTSNALFGHKTSISGNWAIIASPQKDIDDRISEGSVSFFRLSNGEWKFFQEISSPNNSHLSNFGTDVVIKGNTAAISSIGDFDNGRFSGAVYIYNFNILEQTWEYYQKLYAPDAGLGQRFGQSLDLKDNLLIVGAHNANGNSEKSGAAYIFKYENTELGWLNKQKIYANDGESNDFFGYEVHIMNDNHMAIGAYNANNAANSVNRTGAVYVFKSTDNGETWNQATNLRISDANFNDLFGFSISSGPTNKAELANKFNGILYVGAPGTVNENGKTGSVYFFIEDNDGWKNTYELIEQDTGHNDHFGHSVVANNLGDLFIGANKYNTSSLKKAGNVYSYNTYDGGGYNVTSGEPLSGSLLQDYDHYGSHISVDGENIIVSRPFADTDNKSNSGAVDFFRIKSIVNSETNLDELYSLRQNSPNPSNNESVIEFDLRKGGYVNLSLYDISGKLIEILINDEFKNYGSYQVKVESKKYEAGVYLYKLEVNDFTKTLKMIVD